MAVYGIRLPDGRYTYFLDKPEKFSGYRAPEVYADGSSMSYLRPARNSQGFGWFVAETEATEIYALLPQLSKRVHYKLDDPSAVSAKYPAVLTPEQWDERSVREDVLNELYSGVYEEVAPIKHVWEGPYVLLEGREPPGPNEPGWIADLPYELGQRPEYRHLFPGKIPGLRDHLYEVIKAMPGVQFCFRPRDGWPGLDVTVQVPYDPPQQRWQDRYGARGQKLKGGKYVRELAARRLMLPIPDSVPAPNYEAGLAAWNLAVDYWTDLVTSASVTACGHCKGTGHVPEGSEKFEK